MDTLRPRDIRTQRHFYKGRFRCYGFDPRSLGWIPGTQQIRFKILTGVGDLDGNSVLDVGCGFGDLYGYLLANDIHVSYTGVDLNPEFIKVARQVYPDAKFFIADFEEDPVPGRFDWCFESGIFNLRIDNNRDFIRNTLKKMHKMSRKGLAADFLSAGAAFKESYMYYQDPRDLAEFCSTLKGRYAIKSGYRPAEFCVYVYKGGR